MSSANPPSMPPAKPEYSAEKPKSKLWILIVILLLVFVGLPICACVGCFASIYFGVTGMIKGSEPYRVGLERAQASTEVVERLGEPIEQTGFVTGDISLSNGNGSCNLTFEVSGPDGEGTVVVRGTCTNDNWTYDELTVTIDGEAIDISP